MPTVRILVARDLCRRRENSKGVASCGNAESEMGLSRCLETGGALKVPERVPITECSMHATRDNGALIDRGGARGDLFPRLQKMHRLCFGSIEGHQRNIKGRARCGSTPSRFRPLHAFRRAFGLQRLFNHAHSALPRIAHGDRNPSSPPISANEAFPRGHETFR
jgi:hypothetical protein